MAYNSGFLAALRKAQPEAHELLERWERQQTAYIQHREERFATITRVAAAICAETAEPRVLDLAGGIGSLAITVLGEIPTAKIVIADKDPLLLALAEDVASTDDRLSIADVDLDQDDWAEHPAIAEAPFDAVVSSTALHWLQPGVLSAVYRRLAAIVRPGGIVLNGDHFLYNRHTEGTLAAISKAEDQLNQQRSFSQGVDSWEQWWEVAARSPRYQAASERRQEVWGDRLAGQTPKVSLGYHLEALRSADFAETGTVWQYLDDYVLYAVR